MAEQHNAAGPPMLGASTSVSFDDPSTRAVEGVTIKISDEDPNGTVYPYYRADENKSARDWLQGILKDLPAQDEMSIYDIGLGMSRRILVKPGDLMSTLRIFERPAQSVKIEVQGVDINFAPTKKQRFTDALREKMDEWGEPDANLLAYARDSALAACPDGSSTALLDHVEQVQLAHAQPMPACTYACSTIKCCCFHRAMRAALSGENAKNSPRPHRRFRRRLH